MRADLEKLRSILRPVTDAESQALARRIEDEAGPCPPGFVAAELEVFESCMNEQQQYREMKCARCGWVHMW